MPRSNFSFLSVCIVTLLVLTGFQVLMDSEDARSLSLLDMTAKWSFDEGSGDVAEDSAMDNDLRLGGIEGPDAGDPIWSDGVSGTCLDFDGIDDHAIVSDFDMPFNAFTVSFWIKTGHKTNSRVPISYGTAVEENEFILYDCQSLEVYLKNINVDTGISLTDGEWHHVAITWQSSDGNIRVYKDSELRYNHTLIAGETLEQDGALVIGQEQDVMGGGFELSQAFLGRLDEVIILEKVLSGAEIGEYFGGFDLPPTNLSATSGDGSVLLNWRGSGSEDSFELLRADVRNGLKGEYFATENLTGLISTRIDEGINFNWGDGSPITGVPDDHFSVRWSGYLWIDRPDQYMFRILNDDLSRVYVDDRLMIVDTGKGFPTSWYKPMDLERGFVPIRIEYIDIEGNSSVSLKWSSSHFPEHVIPFDRIFASGRDDLLGISEPMGTSYLDEAVLNGRTYAYALKGINGEASSEISNIVLARPSTRTGMALDPTQIEATPGETVEFELSLRNEGGLIQEYSLSVDEIEGAGVGLSEEKVLLAPGVIHEVTLELSLSSDMEEGTYEVILRGSPAGPGDVKEAVGWLVVDADPRITDLLPESGYRSSDTTVLFTWRTSVNSTTELSIRGSGDSDFTVHGGENGTFHSIVVEGLERETDYSFFATSSTDRGSSSSVQRTLRVSSKVVFDRETYRIYIDRDYDQRFTFSIENLDDTVHNVQASVRHAYDDIVVGFTGDGSEDIELSLPPGASRDLAFAVHAQDAMRHEYELIMNLTTLEGEEIFVDHAVVKVVLNHVFVDLDINELDHDPYTLTRRYRITNNGDTVSDLDVGVNPEIAGSVWIEPDITHGYLRSGESIEFTVSPFLDFHYSGLEGVLNVSAYDTTYEEDLNLQVPEGWDVFAGSLYPNWGGVPTHIFDVNDQDNDGTPNDADDDKDGDGIPNAEDQKPLDTDNDGIPNVDDTDDDGDGQPDKSDFFPWDFDNDGVPDEVDPDRDADGVYNPLDPFPDDHDNDTIINGLDIDDDNDQIPDWKDNSPQDHDNDGWADWWDPDYDGDGIVNWEDSYPADMDNDGTPDSSDSDIDGDGIPNEDDSDHNRKPGKGRGGFGSPGGLGGGGGGGWDSEGGKDWYCTNKPELSLFEILEKLMQAYNIAKALYGLAMAFATGGLIGLVVAVVTAVVMKAVNGLKDAGVQAGLDAASQWAGASSWDDVTSTLWNAFADYGKSCFGIAESSGPKMTPLRPSSRSSWDLGLRENVQQYYPDPMIDMSKLQSTLVTTENMYVYFQQDGGDGSDIWCAYSKDLGSSLRDYRKLTDSPGNAYWPYMSCGSGGDATLVWIDDRDGHDEVYMRRTENAGRRWSEEIRVTNHESNKEAPIVVYDRDENIHFIWVDDRDGLRNIFVKKLVFDEYTEEETWTNDYRVTNDYTASTQPAARLGEDDEIHLIFIDNGTGTDEIYHRETSGQEWLVWAFDQITDSGSDKGEPALTVSKNGPLHVVWRDS
ncbi:MAG: LamG-like jellyroll fold domain-containing protein, partial [Thermoplasmatota archaeon]